MPVLATSEPLPLAVDVDGVIRVGKTRVTLDTVVAAFCEGLTAESIVEQYPSLRLSDVYLAIGYYLNHRDEVAEYLEQREALGLEVRQEAERRFSPVGIRDRLLARRKLG